MYLLTEWEDRTGKALARERKREKVKIIDHTTEQERRKMFALCRNRFLGEAE